MNKGERKSDTFRDRVPQKLMEKFRPQRDINLFGFIGPTDSRHVCLGEREKFMVSTNQRRGLFSFTQNKLSDSSGT